MKTHLFICICVIGFVFGGLLGLVCLDKAPVFTYPIRTEVVVNYVNVLTEKQACEKWGGTWNIGEPAYETEGPYIIFYYGNHIYPPYRLLDKDLAESCTKTDVNSQSLY